MIKKRNYQYRSPESPEQQVEAIYEELSETPNEKSKRLNDTLVRTPFNVVTLLYEWL